MIQDIGAQDQGSGPCRESPCAMGSSSSTGKGCCWVTLGVGVAQCSSLRKREHHPGCGTSEELGERTVQRTGSSRGCGLGKQAPGRPRHSQAVHSIPPLWTLQPHLPFPPHLVDRWRRCEQKICTWNSHNYWSCLSSDFWKGRGRGQR
jgi:hypothetical protein